MIGVHKSWLYDCLFQICAPFTYLHSGVYFKTQLIFITTLLRCSLHPIQYTWSITFSGFECNHKIAYLLILGHCHLHPPQKHTHTPHTHTHTPTLTPLQTLPSPRQPLLLFCLYRFAYSKRFYKWNHVCGLRDWPLTECDLFFCLFDCSYFCECEGITHGGFDLHYPEAKIVEHLFTYWPFVYLWRKVSSGSLPILSSTICFLMSCKSSYIF